MTPARATAIVRDACVPYVGKTLARSIALVAVPCADRVDLHIALAAYVEHRRRLWMVYGRAWARVSDADAAAMVARVREAAT